MGVDYDVIVIGAGNAGLAAAATLQRGGQRVLLLERHNVPGGAATTFVRGRFEFEVSLHQLGGMAGPAPLRHVLDEMDVTRRVEFIEDDQLYRTVVPGVLDVTLPADWRGIADALDEQYPVDRARLTAFLELVRDVGMWQLTARANLHRLDHEMERLRSLPHVRRHGLRPFRDVLEEYVDNERVRLVLSSYWCYNGQLPSRISFMDYARVMALYVETKPYQVVGGSQALSYAMLRSFQDAGGRARFHTAVDRIVTRGGRAVGVRLENGETVSCRLVVSNAPATTTYTRLLDPADVPGHVLRDLRSRRMGISASVLYLGLDASPAELGFTTAANFIHSDLTEESLLRGMHTLEPAPFLLASCYDVKPNGGAPAGATQLNLVALQYAEPWESVPVEEYRRAKAEYAESLLELLKAVSPGVRDVIEEAELATPITFKRYLSQPGGAIYGFDQDVTDGWLFHDDDLKPNVPGVVLASNWVTAAGYNSTIVTSARMSRRLLEVL
ncbi:NAD(P)/FAD-dependent oxidoreductase [Streptomyces sp. NPDC006798]|uniref:phytoene desaturase family protein n=1 Tax=Streptomyces sp. NPDC006798 TaxID=3155462 RepID=UPI00340BE4E2